MPQKRKTEAGAINIRMHPHPSPDYYISLLKDAFSLRRPISGRGDQKLLMSFLDKPRQVDDITEVRGIIARFTNIEPDSSWFNLYTNDEAEAADVRQIKIPDYLKPNYQPFSFVFFPHKHRFVFEKYSGESSISHGIMAKYLETLFADSLILQKYGVINIDVVSDQKGLETILNIPVLRHLEIIIDRPNADDHADEEKKLLQRMNAQKINRIEQRMTAASGESISPDNRTKTLAKIALDNGKVQADGRDRHGNTVAYSTTKFPRTETHKYDPDLTSAADAFNLLAKKFVR